MPIWAVSKNLIFSQIPIERFQTKTFNQCQDTFNSLLWHIVRGSRHTK